MDKDKVKKVLAQLSIVGLITAGVALTGATCTPGSSCPARAASIESSD